MVLLFDAFQRRELTHTEMPQELLFQSFTPKSINAIDNREPREYGPEIKTWKIAFLRVHLVYARQTPSQLSIQGRMYSIKKRTQPGSGRYSVPAAFGKCN